MNWKKIFSKKGNVNSNLSNKTYLSSDFTAQQATLNTSYCFAVRSGNIAFVQLRFTTSATITDANRIIQFPTNLIPSRTFYGLLINTWGTGMAQFQLDTEGRLFKAGAMSVSTDYMLSMCYICG